MTRKRRVSRRLRQQVAQRAGYCCGYCRTPERITGHRMTLAHIIPEAQGGQTVIENLWLACVACNEFKGARIQARDPVTGRRVRLFNPCKQIWREHFRWSTDGMEIFGRTLCGRATVAALRLNREEIVGARWLWVQAGWWPPED
jgi:hypothetical protein